MSQRMWANYGFGLIVDDYDTAEKIAQLNSEDFDDEDEYGSGSTYDFFFDLGKCLIMDEGTAGNFVNLIDKEGKVRMSCTVDFAVCIYSKKQADVLSRSYTSIDKIVEEFSQELSFPKDFKIKDHIGYFSCVVCD